MNNNEVIFHYLYQKNKQTGEISEYRFSNEFSISTNGNSLSIKKNPLYIKNFYGKNISNLSIAVGSNGSGKTTLCLKLIEFIGDSQSAFEFNELAYIFSRDGKLYGRKSDIIMFSPGSIKFQEIKNKEIDNISHNQLLPIFLTFVFNYSSENILNSTGNYSTYKNLSTTHLLKTAVKSKSPGLDVENIEIYNALTLDSALTAFREDEFTRIVSIIDYDDLFNDFNIKIPPYIKFNINLAPIIDSKNQKDDQYNELLDKINTTWVAIIMDKNIPLATKFKLKFINRCILSIILNYRILVNHGKKIDDLILNEINNIIKDYFKNPKNELYIKEVFRKVGENKFAKATINDLYLGYYFDLENIIDELLLQNKLSTAFSDTNFIFINYKESTEIIKKFKDIYFKENISFKPITMELSHINYNSSLSSGELTLLSFFGRLIGLTFYDLPSNLFLMIDEADLTLHPQWQKKYLNSILKFLNNILPSVLAKRYNKMEPKIQLLITTHSPIILSDVVSNSVVYLEEVENSSHSTFAQNIHELFNNDFILKNGLIGDFAQSKIDEIINWIDTHEPITSSELSKFLVTIKNISEPFIRFKLMEMLEGNILVDANKEEFYTEKNKMIEEQIKILEALKTIN